MNSIESDSFSHEEYDKAESDYNFQILRGQILDLLTTEQEQPKRAKAILEDYAVQLAELTRGKEISEDLETEIIGCAENMLAEFNSDPTDSTTDQARVSHNVEYIREKFAEQDEKNRKDQDDILDSEYVN